MHGCARDGNCFDVLREAIDAGFKECQIDIIYNKSFSWQKMEGLLVLMREYPLSSVRTIANLNYNGEEFYTFVDAVMDKCCSPDESVEFLKYLINNNIRSEDEIYEVCYTFFKK